MPRSNHETFLAVDIGNQQIKLGRFVSGDEMANHPVEACRLSTQGDDLDALSAWLPDGPIAWYVATVHRQAEQRLASWVHRQRAADAYRLVTNADIPMEMRVEHPRRVGTDRLLAAAAADRLRTPGRAAIVVDAGSAITVDLVSADGAFEGGVILPGLRIMGQALDAQTDALPFVPGSLTEAPPPVVGKSTEAAIRSGMYWGAVGAVREVVSRMVKQLPTEPELFLAGGDAQHFAPYLDGQLHIAADLVFAGLALVYRHLNRGMESPT
jgi:type III pantothenate kinase